MERQDIESSEYRIHNGELEDFFEEDIDEEVGDSLDFFYQADYNENDIMAEDFLRSVDDNREKAFYWKLIRSKKPREKTVDALAVDITNRVFDEHPLAVTSEALSVTVDGVSMECVSDLLVIEVVEDIFVVVIEDKVIHHHNGESGLCQIAGELLACAQYNDEDGVQYIYAIRFIGHYVTFFLAEISPEILESYRNGEKPSDELTIRMFPDKSKLGLNLMDQADRRLIIETLRKMKAQLLHDFS